MKIVNYSKEKENGTTIAVEANTVEILKEEKEVMKIAETVSTIPPTRQITLPPTRKPLQPTLNLSTIEEEYCDLQTTPYWNCSTFYMKLGQRYNSFQQSMKVIHWLNMSPILFLVQN